MKNGREEISWGYIYKENVPVFTTANAVIQLYQGDKVYVKDRRKREDDHYGRYNVHGWFMGFMVSAKYI